MKKIAISALKTLGACPLSVLYVIADVLGFLLWHVVGYRKKVVHGNLISAFPSKSAVEIKKIEKEFYKYLGDQIVETLKLFHISDAEMRRRVRVVNYEAVNESLEGGRNVVLLMGHYCNWEWVQEISRYFVPGTFMASIYHPLKDKTWDQVFIDLRSRWHAHIVPMRQAPKALLNKGNMPWVCGFIADARPDYRNDDNWIEFLNHKTWFIYGPEEIGNKVKADFFYLEMTKIRRGYYEIMFHRLNPDTSDLRQQGNLHLHNEPKENRNGHESYPYTREFWKEFEKTIEKAPAYWLWSHKRWK
ncbi:MAG: lysophospholipid acyltransferase family protein [Muribaculaceae bacterium]|nr:lysophospholipid acyltransferase family protein [Muribaculaceae bacterium]